MKFQAKKISYKRIALALSLCALMIWGVLGAGTSLAWFADTSPEINNIFHFADFNLKVSYLDANRDWAEVFSQTDIFDQDAKYEPGYVQVVYLKVENEGTAPFRFYTAVNVNGCTPATNMSDETFLLHDYLKFGITITDTPEDMKNSVADRDTAIAIANEPLHKYYEIGQYYETDTNELAPGATKYMALVVRMPEEVGNVANYRDDTVPKVELGITVKADQIKN